MSKTYELSYTAERIDEMLKEVDEHTIYSDATTEEHGLMSTTDKTKLDALPTAQQIEGSLSEKVDKVEGKGLSKNDYTDADKAKVTSALQTETDPTVPSWAKQQNKPSYDYSEIGNTPDLSGFITKSVNDLTNYYLKSETYTKDEVAALIGAIQQFHYEIYATLPQTGQSNVLYLIGPTGSGSDRYEEYVYANNAFTKIGDTSIDLSGYVTISALNTALAGYTPTSELAEVATSGSYNDLTNKPSIPDISGKADKVSNSTNGNFAGLDANGNLTDSGKKASDFATASQGAKADTAYQKPQAGIPETDLSSDVQSQLNKHFKGWYDSSSDLPANPVVGDYAYVKGASSTDPAAIYECTINGSWSDSDRTVDTSNVQTFETLQQVNEVSIVNDLITGGTEDVLSAEQGKVLNNSKVEVSVGSNILNIDTVVSGAILNTSGSVSDMGALLQYKYTDYIPIYEKSITIYKALADGSNNTLCVYDSNKQWKRGVKLTNSNSVCTFTPSDGDAYIRVNVVWNNTSTTPPYANYGTTLLDYEPYNPIKGYLGDVEELQQDVSTLQQSVGSIQVQINNKVDFNCTNILDYSTVISGGILNGNGSVSELDNQYKYTDFIPINGKSITISNALSGNNNRGCVYDANKQLRRGLGYSTNPLNEDGSITFIPNVDGKDAYIRFNLVVSSTSTPHANYGTTLLDFEPYNPISGYLDDVKQKISDLQDDVDEIGNPNFLIDQFKSLFNSVICIGDSMTAGYTVGQGDDYSISYPAFMAKMSGWNVENTATGGQTPKGWYVNKFPLYTYTDYDVAIIYLGQNEGLTNTLNTDTFDGTQWAANTPYSVGTIVQYNRIGKKCIEAHTSGDSFDATKWTDAYTDYSNTNTGRYCSIIEGMLVQNPKLIIFLLSGTAVSSWNSSDGVVINQISARYGNLPVFNIKDNPWVDLHKLEYHPHYSSGTTTDYIHYGTIGYLSLGRVIYSYILKYINEHQSEFATYKEN